MRKLCILFTICILLQISNVKAQSVGVNDDGSASHTSAMLDVYSTTKGMLIPRVALTATNVAGPVSSPLTSLLVYNTATAGSGATAVTPGFYYWNGSSSWEKITSSSTPLNAWSLGGNAGTNSSNFIGTTDEQPLLFKVANGTAGQIQYSNYNTSFGRGTLEHTEVDGDYFGNKNTAFGNGALYRNSSGYSNTAQGFDALFLNTSGFLNTAIGTSALQSNTTGFGNTGIGHNALNVNESGNENTAIGGDALYSNYTGTNNTAVGNNALFSNTASYNTAVGSGSLQGNSDGVFNTSIGVNSLQNNLNGHSNTAVGFNSLNNNSGNGTTEGNGNTAIGRSSLQANTIGTYNTASGVASLGSNIDGDYNTAAGSSSLAANTEGNLNVAFGYASMISNSTGTQNSAYGANSMLTNTTGTKNTAIGVDADVSTGSLTNATAIGYGAIVDASDKVRIGNAAVTVIEGQVAFTLPSDGRFKTNVTESVKGLDFIMKLRPVVYNIQAGKMEAFKNGGYLNAKFTRSDYTPIESIRQSGFIAQEVEKAAIETGYDFNGVKKPQNDNDTYGLSYSQFVVPLVKAIQEQQQQIETLKKENEELKKLKDQVEALTKTVQNLSTNK